MGYWQTVQIQIRHHRMRHLIRVYTVCLNDRKVRFKWQSPFRTVFFFNLHLETISPLMTSGHMTFIQLRLNVDATSWRCLTLRRHYINVMCQLGCQCFDSTVCTREIAWVTSCLHSCTPNRFWKLVSYMKFNCEDHNVKLNCEGFNLKFNCEDYNVMFYCEDYNVKFNFESYNVKLNCEDYNVKFNCEDCNVKFNREDYNIKFKCKG